MLIRRVGGMGALNVSVVVSKATGVPDRVYVVWC